MIGVFDSGFGGLTILSALLKRLPQYDYLYLGDSARTPYGSHSDETIRRYSREAVEFLFAQGCRLILVACNTVSAVALRELQEEYLVKPGVQDRKILGVIFPLMEKAVELSGHGRVGVVGTRATVQSGAYEREIKKLMPNGHVYSQACPLLVPFIEEGWERKPEAIRVLKKYVRSLKTCRLDTLILGCTHYPLMHDTFARAMGKNVHVLDTGPTVAESLADYLQRHPGVEGVVKAAPPPERGEGGVEAGTRRFLTTGDAARFKELGSRFLGRPIEKVETVRLST